jgi:hypothetical protein
VALIYIQLLDEAVQVWRPVEAEAVGVHGFRIVGKRPEDERWEFEPGDLVRCETRKLTSVGPSSAEPCPVAVKRVTSSD